MNHKKLYLLLLKAKLFVSKDKKIKLTRFHRGSVHVNEGFVHIKTESILIKYNKKNVPS